MGVMAVLGAITVNRQASSVALLRRYARGTLDREGVHHGDTDVLVSELGTNAVQHGAGERMTLLVSGDDTRIRFEVSDQGGTGDAPHLRTDVGDEEERGRGLFLVAALAEEWGVHPRPGDTTVWADIPRKPAG